ncbi:hypothetical protein BLA29_001610 [Euroglyphus maynei]|uniref:Uncharacterized protein n=1 Tax=Euroglyphus maynei TaxID=6958 RepID=A0A1Y3BQY2_EURMA|nr:hypothetical protein BLA29_001610 [Euroglyphus maynei]
MNPFGAMAANANSTSDSLCSTFGSAAVAANTMIDSRWPVSPMPSHSIALRAAPSTTITTTSLVIPSSSFNNNGGAQYPTPTAATAPYSTSANSMNCSPPTPNQPPETQSPTGQSSSCSSVATTTTSSCSPGNSSSNGTASSWLCSDSAWQRHGNSTIVTLRRKALEHSVMTIR